MTSSGRRELGTLRSSLVDTAWRMFAASPPAGVSTRDIAQASGCTHGLITRHFGSKAGLEQTVSERLAQVLEVTVIKGFTQNEWPFAEFIREWRAHPRVGRLLVRTGLRDLPIQPIIDQTSLGHRLVGRIEESRGGHPNAPTQRSRMAAYLTLCGLFGLFTFDDFFTWATRIDPIDQFERDRVSAQALRHIAELASSHSVDLRLPRSRAVTPTAEQMAVTQRPRGEREVRAALVAAAGELFALKGPAAVGIREISDRAGLQHGLIHRYFGTKDALLAAAIEREYQPIQSASSTGSEFDIPMFVRMNRRRGAPWLLARALADGADVRRARQQTPIVDAILHQFPNLPEGAGPATLANPRLAFHAAACMVFGAAIWDEPVRALVGLPPGDDVDLDAPVSAVALHLLRIPIDG